MGVYIEHLEQVDRYASERLFMLRSMAGVELEELSRHTGISRQDLVAYEEGRTSIPVADLLLLSKAFAVDVLSFFGESNESNIPGFSHPASDEIHALH